MSPGELSVLAAVATLVAAVLAVVLIGSVRGRHRLETSLAASQEELAELRRRVDGLSREVPPRPPRGDDTEYVITTAGRPDPDEPAVPAQQLTAGQFASVAVGESLVTLLSIGYGVRRALSPENRNRIAFEMRREVRRARKQRRRELREHRRRLRDADLGNAA